MMIAPSRGSRSRTVLILGLSVAAGCGGGSGKQNYRDAVAFPEVGTTASGGGAGTSAAGTGGGAGSGPTTGTGGRGPTTGTGGGGPTTGTGGGGPVSDGSVPHTDGGFTIIDAAPPAATNQQVISGDAILVGPGLSCSRAATPAAGAAAPDRWCGFVRPVVSAAGTATLTLYVFNLTKALAGTAVTCAAADVNCLMLDADLATDDNASHGFNGQTLIYYTAKGSYAWRPGWTAGRLLISAITGQAHHCEASPADVPTAICIQEDVTATSYNTFAGNIAMQTGPVLPALESLNGTSSSIGFSPDSLSVLYSVVTNTTTGVETLKMQTIGDDTTRKTVATGIVNWTLSADGSRWFWMSAPTTDNNGFTTGILQAAPYPAGTSPVNVQGKTLNYLPYGPKSVVSISTPTTTGADLKTVTDVDSPTTTTVVQSKTAFGVLDVHTNGTILYYDDLDQPDPTVNAVLVNLRVAKADGTGKCAVTALPTADPGASITRAGNGVGWLEILFDAATGNLSAVNGQVTTLADCTPHLFSPTVYSYIDVMTGFLVQENFDSGVIIADLSYRMFSAAGAPNAPMKIQTAADVPIEALQPDLAKVLFSINGRQGANGIFASPTLTGTPTASIAPVIRKIGGAIASRAALQPQPQPLTLLGRVGAAWSSSAGAASRFSPYARKPDVAAAARDFARFSVPPLLRRTAAR